MSGDISVGDFQGGVTDVEVSLVSGNLGIKVMFIVYVKPGSYKRFFRCNIYFSTFNDSRSIYLSITAYTLVLRRGGLFFVHTRTT